MESEVLSLDPPDFFVEILNQNRYILMLIGYIVIAVLALIGVLSFLLLACL